LHKGKQIVNVAVRPAFTFSSISLCREFALGGPGVTMLRKLLAFPDKERGDLVRLLPDWSGAKHDLFALMNPGQTPKRVRIFVDYLMHYFAGVSV
jgi:DNA-binding transcriptional LysR family regulator